jgi:hypothetical protein
MATIDTQTRKVGDTLRLSGELSGDTIPTADASWVGATALININSTTGTVYRAAGSVTLTATTAPRLYSYAGTAPIAADIGTYVYEIQVTFADGTITTFPNNADLYKLKIVAQLG